LRIGIAAAVQRLQKTTAFLVRIAGPRFRNGYGSDSNSAAISAADNYFGTTDAALIDEMIYDRKDDLSAASFISTSHINAPSPDAPRLFAGTDGSAGC
jgi:hypothetical protein